jgi:hypothetical protein
MSYRTKVSWGSIYLETELALGNARGLQVRVKPNNQTLNLKRHSAEVAQVLVTAIFAMQTPLHELDVALEHRDWIPQVVTRDIEEPDKCPFFVSHGGLFIERWIHKQLPFRMLAGASVAMIMTVRR